MNPVFLDTVGLIALWDETDQWHVACCLDSWRAFAMTMQVVTGVVAPGTLGHVDAIRAEIATYRRELSRLLAEGHGGPFVVIKGNVVISLWDTSDEAYQAGCQRFGAGPFLAQPVDPRDLTRVFPEGY